MNLEKITVRELLRRASNDIGLISDEEDISAQLAKSCFIMANETLAEWNNDELVFPFHKYQEIKLDGSASYEITYRPTAGIKKIFFKNLPDISVALSEMTESDFLLKKENSNNINNNPTSFFYDNTFGTATLYIFPYCNYGKLIISSSGEFDRFKDLDEVIELPDGFVLAIKMNIAVKMAQKYNLEISQDYIDKSVKVKSKLINSSQNNIVSRLSSDYNRFNNSGNIYSGW